MIFEWDENKNRINMQKHGIAFNEAVTVFRDDNALIISDDEHSEQEERFIILGLSNSPRLLAVCHSLLQGKRFYNTYNISKKSQ